MVKNEIKLEKNVNSVTIDVASADITILPDDTTFPIIRSSGEINIRERENKVIIKEKQMENTMNSNNIFISGCKGITIVSSGSSRVQIGRITGDNVIVNNGIVFSMSKNNDSIFSFGESSSVELIVPKKTQIKTFNIDTISGNLTIKDLILSKLVAKTKSGNITLNDIDVLFGKLKTMSGNIDAKILESIINYKIYLKSISGNTIQNSIETTLPTLLSEKHELEARTMSGNVKILFKGKK